MNRRGNEKHRKEKDRRRDVGLMDPNPSPGSGSGPGLSPGPGLGLGPNSDGRCHLGDERISGGRGKSVCAPEVRPRLWNQSGESNGEQTSQSNRNQLNQNKSNSNQLCQLETST